MSDIAIRVDHLSKLYHIGRAQQRHDTLRDALVSAFKRSNVATMERSDELWALQDVSLEVQQGEVVGIIGRNGAGKSTLLKILSRITEPTRGLAEIHGRVGSLLEVGTGFHPELTGRENIYLNGAILGMRRFEIDRKFDEIVAFAEIERFLDTPVKRYSSGTLRACGWPSRWPPTWRLDPAGGQRVGVGCNACETDGGDRNASSDIGCEHRGN